MDDVGTPGDTERHAGPDGGAGVERLGRRRRRHAAEARAAAAAEHVPERQTERGGAGGPRERRDGAYSVEETVRAIRQLRSRQERERTGVCYIEGGRIVAQALAAGMEIVEGVIAPSLLVGDHAWSVANALDASGAPILELSAEAFGAISFKENLQGIGAVIRPRMKPLAEVTPSAETLGWVTLATVGNPGNLGAILRTCDAVGCAGIILLGETTDPYHPAAVRASMGAVFSQRLVRADMAEFTRWTARHGCTVVGTSPAATQEYREVAYPRPVVLLMGSERLGLSPEQQHLCDLLVHIPMIGTGDSLNLAVATGVMLYEVFHQRRARGRDGDGRDVE
ncbi:MAG: hypothetical protein NVSMB65_18780 [Chloroflexota bacterium]